MPIECEKWKNRRTAVPCADQGNGLDTPLADGEPGGFGSTHWTPKAPVGGGAGEGVKIWMG